MPPGYPWATGDALLAADLNAAIANSAAHGPFLPVSGGTVTGDVHVTGKLWQGYAATPPTWAYPNTNPGGVGWFELSAEAQFYTKGGGAAVAAVGRSSDSTPTPGYHVYSYLGYGLSDVAGGLAEAMYLEAAKTVATASAICIEMDAINLVNEIPTINPYQIMNQGVTAGISIAAGGGPGRPGPFYPSSVALVIDHNNSNWMRGIVFGAAGLNGTHGIAVQMATGHEMQWTFDSTGARSAFIRCDATAATGVGILFNSTSLNVVDAATETSRFSVTAGGAVNVSGGGLHLGGVIGSGPTDVTKHIEMFTGAGYGFGITAGQLNYNVPTSAIHSFYVAAANVGTITPTGLNYMAIGATGAAAGAFTAVQVGSAVGPTIRSGTGAATGTQPKGSLWLRTDGAAGSTLYVTQGAGVWAAVAGV